MNLKEIGNTETDFRISENNYSLYSLNADTTMTPKILIELLNLMKIKVAKDIHDKMSPELKKYFTKDK